jgi:hypothetical protein
MLNTSLVVRRWSSVVGRPSSVVQLLARPRRCYNSRYEFTRQAHTCIFIFV